MGDTSTREKAKDHFQEWITIVSRPRKALLVEDSMDDTMLIVKTSDSFNIQWDVAFDGLECLQKLKSNKYDLIIMDLKLSAPPDGITLFNGVKVAAPLTPVLILSGYITNEIILKITRIGFAMFTQKPGAFNSDFFEQFFSALNVPKLSRGGSVEPKMLNDEVTI